jgi:hypothetical protein
MTNIKKQLKGKPRGKPWPQGVSGNPAGRPKGALHKLTRAVRGEVLAVFRQVISEQTPLPDPIKYDPKRPHAHTMTKIDGCWRRTVEQEGQVFDRETRELIGPEACDDIN